MSRKDSYRTSSPPVSKLPPGGYDRASVVSSQYSQSSVKETSPLRNDPYDGSREPNQSYYQNSQTEGSGDRYIDPYNNTQSASNYQQHDSKDQNVPVYPGSNYGDDPSYSSTIGATGSTHALTSYPPQTYDEHGYPIDMRGSTDDYRDQYGYYPPAPYSDYQDSQFDIYNDFNNTRQAQSNDQSSSPTQGGGADGNSYPMNAYGDSPDEMGLKKSTSNQVAPEPLSMQKQRRRCCGCPCCVSSRVCVIITFVVLVVLAIVLFFIWPRIPTVTILNGTAVGTPRIEVDPPVINLQFDLRVQVKNPENWVPIRFNRIEARVFDVNTLDSYKFPVATGNVTDYSLPPRRTSIIDFPLTVDYKGNTTDDRLIQDFKSACTPASGQAATTLNVRADIKLFVWGISWAYKPTVSVSISNFECPFAQIRDQLTG